MSASFRLASLFDAEEAPSLCVRVFEKATLMKEHALTSQRVDGAIVRREVVSASFRKGCAPRTGENRPRRVAASGRPHRPNRVRGIGVPPEVRST